MNFEILWNKALAAGNAAGIAAKPVPMVVSEANGLSNVPDPNGRSWYVPDGVCGFAWVKVKGNTAFGRWASKMKVMRKAYGGGLDYWISEFGQSMDRKEAFARAMANVLSEAGIVAYPQSRMD